MPRHLTQERAVLSFKAECQVPHCPYPSDHVTTDVWAVLCISVTSALIPVPTVTPMRPQCSDDVTICWGPSIDDGTA